MLFLLRPRQTWMGYGLPRDAAQQRLHNEQLHLAYQSTRRVGPPAPGAQLDPVARLQELARLHEAGSLTDAEFAQAKALVLASSGGAGAAGRTSP